MQRLPLIASAFLMTVTPGVASDQTWTGTITDTTTIKVSKIVAAGKSSS